MVLSTQGVVTGGKLNIVGSSFTKVAGFVTESYFSSDKPSVLNSSTKSLASSISRESNCHCQGLRSDNVPAAVKRVVFTGPPVDSGA